ncbi:LysM peptidoglycan-binding domain-containing protein [Tessaracoccus sp. OS52]|uniref:LysM peptidoglycan-binding domain-containing protein n=1 Tax=Tessaracoccus sp. OS52 TaxID=2886691 RepID=UPI001D1227BB|nr:LysM peptidoglycan-binding domain-containing protein [Tessaracoccus sp. OS52]MCC2592484.1 LysM peptidoglycan-binding domain-containing protein [Tessaracoccus sp. OS52]
MASRLKGLAACLAILGILAGVPVVLLQLALKPGFFPTWDRLQVALISPDDGRLMLVFLWTVSWIAWLALSWLICVEIIAAVRGLEAPRLRALSVPQGLVRQMVVTAAMLFVAAPIAVSGAAPAAAADPGGEPTAVTVAPAHKADTVEVTVNPGDTLWEYAAEHLGHGGRWPEIFEANRGRPQLDGNTLTDPDLLNEGWKLAIPPSAKSTAVGGAGDAGEWRVIVGPGDTLWDLAERHLHDGARWPEIFDANEGIQQVDGHVLTDPDIIHPGWVLTIPAAVAPQPDGVVQPVPAPPGHPADAGSEETIRPETPEPESPATPPPTPAATPSTPTNVPTARPTAATMPPGDELQEVAESPTAPGWHVAGLLGAGAFLGAGVLAVLSRQRRDQFRQRQPGLTIAVPDPVTAPIEMTATVAAGLTADRLAHLDSTLRRLAATHPAPPAVTAVCVARDGTITLHTSSELQEPWLPVPEGWQLPTEAAPADVGPLNPDKPAPYPLLVTIGADDSDGAWLLNLETVGLITIGGDPLMRDDLLRYIAAELAVNPWAGDVQVACLGIATETVPMAPERFTTTPDRVTRLAADNVNRATRTGTDAASGRLHQLEDEAWPAILVISSETVPADEFRRLIDDHAGCSGAALLQCVEQGADLVVTSSGRVTGLGFDLVAVGLTVDEAAGCAALLAVAAEEISPGEPVPPADDLTDKTGNLLPEVTVPRGASASGSSNSVLPAPDEDFIAAAPVTATDLQLLAPRTSPKVTEKIMERDPDLDRDVEDWFSDRCSRPRLTWLGPVKARCHGRPPTKSKAYYTEVLSYLAAHPNGVTNDELVDAFSITPERARTVISNLRQWVGINPATGKPLIPDAKASPQAITRGVGLYLVDDLLIDADLFRRLRTRAHARGPAGIPDLETALRLVTGRPFEQLRPTGWAWLAQGDRIDHHMVAAVGDVAHTLVTHHLHAGNPTAARQAAQTALSVCPESETAALDLAGIMVQEGNSHAAHELLADALGERTSGDPVDPSARAVEILLGADYLKTA